MSARRAQTAITAALILATAGLLTVVIAIGLLVAVIVWATP